MPCFRKGAMELFKRIYNDYRELQLIVEVKVEIIDRIASIWSIFTEGFHSKCDITHKKAQKHYLFVSRGLSLFTNSRWFTTDEAAAES